MARTLDPVRHREKRHAVATAAAELFARQGFDGTSTAEMSRAAGISTGNLFHYFPSKLAVLEALVEHVVETDAARIEELAGAGDPWEGLLRALRAMADGLDDPLAAALAMEVVVQAYRHPRIAAILDAGEERERRVITSLLERVARHGGVELAMAPDEAADWVLALVQAAFIRALDGATAGQAAAAALPDLVARALTTPGGRS